MRMNVLIAVFVSVITAFCGYAIAGPGDKGKVSVVIEHTNGSEGGEGSVEIVVSVPAAIAHLSHHEQDCLTIGGTDTDTANYIANALGTDIDSLECIFVGTE